MSRPRDDRQKDLLRPALEEIIDLDHPLARLVGSFKDVFDEIITIASAL